MLYEVITASTIHVRASSLTDTVPWFGGMSGATIMVAIPRCAAKPRLVSYNFV